MPDTVPAAASETSGGEPEPTPAAPDADADADAADAAAASTAGPPEPAAQVAKPPRVADRYAALLTQTVGDYEAWKQVFDDNQALRQQAGITRHTVLLHPKARARVTVLLASPDLDPLQAFLDGDELAKAMKSAGVKGKPVVHVLRLQDSATSEALGGLVSAFVKFEVTDYDAWKEGFDADAQAREQAGLEGYAIATAVDDAKKVYLYLQAQEQEMLDKFLSGPALSKAPGVRGKPEITKHTEEEEETYE